MDGVPQAINQGDTATLYIEKLKAGDSGNVSIVQVRPVLPDDVSEYRRGVEAARDVVDYQFLDTTQGGLMGFHPTELRKAILAALARIDNLLAEVPNVSAANDDSEPD
jgi:hypothetical protein